MLVLLAWIALSLLLGAARPLLSLLVLALLCLGGMLLVTVSDRLGTALKMGVAFLLLIAMSLPPMLVMALIPDRTAMPFNSELSLKLLLLPLAALVWAALLLRTQPAGAAAAPGPVSAHTISLLLAALLLIKALHTLFWFFVWDSTYDALDFLWLIFILPVALFAVLVMAQRRPAWGLGGGVLLPLLIGLVYGAAQQVDFRELTTQRAERVAQAVVRYEERNGRYPHTLAELSPGPLSFAAPPITFYGETWCYEGGADYYRLAYVDRAHWSSPELFANVHAVAGNVTQLPSPCSAHIRALQSQDPNFYTMRAP